MFSPPMGLRELCTRQPWPDVAPFSAKNIRKVDHFWPGCEMEPFQESAPGALKYELLENKLDNKGQIVIAFPPGKPWNSPLRCKRLRKCRRSASSKWPIGFEVNRNEPFFLTKKVYLLLKTPFLLKTNKTINPPKPQNQQKTIDDL